MRSILLFALAAACAVSPNLLQAAPTAVRPNVVFILADDLGVNDLSLYGSKFHETPNIDALARRGMKFTSAYSASPLCSPTRSSILSGLYPARLGITAPDCHLPKVVLEKKLNATAPPTQKALTAESVTRFATSHYTLAKAFKTAGYATAHFGKWHLGPEPYSPLEQGFDMDIPHTPEPSPLGKGFFYPFPVWKNHGKPGDNLEDLLCDEAVKFIEQHKDQPFFLNYWAFEVHSPWQANEEQIDKYRAKAKPDSLQRNPVYAGMLETLDEVVGRLVAALEKAGVLERTVIVFTSDNGPYFIPNREHMPAEFHTVPVTSAQPLRAGKGTIYEAGTRVPLLVVWPGRVKPGSASDALVQSTDFFPTFADALGWKLPDGLRFDGVSQRRVLEGGVSVRDEIFCHFPHGQARGEYEQMPAPTLATPASSLRKDDWKLIRFYCDNADRTDRHELYNLATDPGERSDLAAAQPDRVQQLAVRLDAVLKETDALIPKPNPAFKPARVPTASSTESARSRVIVLADMGNEPDEEQQMLHLLMCANEFEVDGLLAVTGKFLRPEDKNAYRQKLHPELFTRLIDGYAKVYPNLKIHAAGWPTPEHLHSVVASGQTGYGIADTGDGKASAGSKLIIDAVTKADARPVHIVVNAGANSLAQALIDYRATHSAAELKAFVAKLRVFENGAQDNSGAWICHEFPDIFWVRSNYQTYCFGGPSNTKLGPHNWKPYAHSATGQDDWAKENVRTNHGAFGELYPARSVGKQIHFLEGGGTIPWMGLVCHGLTDSAEPSWGGWSGRFSSEKIQNVWSRHNDIEVDEQTCVPFAVYTEVKDRWTDPEDGKVYDDSSAPIWRWRTPMWNDFKARMDWCVQPYAKANHHPHAVINGDASDAIFKRTAKASEVLTFSASGSSDPDKDALRFSWWVYPEAGRRPYGKELPIENASSDKITLPILPDAAGSELHLILEVWDKNTTVPLVDYRRMVITITQ